MDSGEKRCAGTGADRQLVVMPVDAKMWHFARPRPPPGVHRQERCGRLRRLGGAPSESLGGIKAAASLRILGGTDCNRSKIVVLFSLHLYP